MFPRTLSAQSLNATDTTEIQQKALRYVRQFESLLNIISQSDEYFRKYSFNRLIQNYYSDQSSYQIFRDSLVVVEDDLNPKAELRDYGNLLTIKDYLQAFFSLYEKSPPPSVIFNNYEVSDVQEDEFLYVEVFYDSKFRNRHRAYPDLAYPVRHRRATVKAEPQNSGWRVVITDIGYARPGDPRPSSVVAQRSVPAGNRAQQTEEAVTDTVTAAEPRATADEEAATAPQKANQSESPAPTTEATAPANNAFVDIRRVYRTGKTYPLPVRLNPAAPPTSLMLYQGTELVRDFSGSLADSASVWRVPQTLSPGDNYRLQFSGSPSGEATESTPFAIRRRARWPWVVGAIGAAAVIYAVVGSSDDGGEDPVGEDELPPPPFPE